ncbi:hypothetical protein AALP_AA3G220500 [Arabis alpina]|uniref:Serpin domain-containing protein n=1 Tax=Arabis alpina TaxID=50452 RepID=A0A087HAV3_ARAAL|nr:hypothetical protein AALP_AA3G220500 [Arabis alpina]
MEKHNDVVVKLAKHVITTVAKNSNLVFSPTSINVMLSLIAAGSNSVSKEQILSFLMSPSTDHLNAILTKIVSIALTDGNERSYLRLSTANGVWINNYVSLKTSFKELLENSYKATCSQVDFANKWGSRRGNDDDDEVERLKYFTYKKGSGELKLRQAFHSIEAFKKAMMDYVLKNGWNVQYCRWDTDKSELKCATVAEE